MSDTTPEPIPPSRFTFKSEKPSLLGSPREGNTTVDLKRALQKLSPQERSEVETSNLNSLFQRWSELELPSLVKELVASSGGTRVDRKLRGLLRERIDEYLEQRGYEMVDEVIRIFRRGKDEEIYRLMEQLPDHLGRIVREDLARLSLDERLSERTRRLCGSRAWSFGSHQGLYSSVPPAS